MVHQSSAPAESLRTRTWGDQIRRDHLKSGRSNKPSNGPSIEPLNAGGESMINCNPPQSGDAHCFDLQLAQSLILSCGTSSCAGEFPHTWKGGKVREPEL